ncbi:hypothetical protein GOBAR_DD10714 [Gossypium barbadense]|nr:hypothetical protein GOBAR_DD10714 [Gossypium barbadense]
MSSVTEGRTSSSTRHCVCDYTGVYCTPALDNKRNKLVTSIDLNHGDITGYLPEELGLLTGFVLFHINSN